ncbi:hypothetical protein ACS0TY_003716 [Phlomoides rotata]
MKEHLTCKPGNITSYPKVPNEVYIQMKSILSDIDQSKMKKRNIHAPVFHESEDEEESPNLHVSGRRKKRKKTIGSYMKDGSGSGVDLSQPSIQASMQNKERKHETDMDVALWFYDACIPMNAVNSRYFKKMIIRVASMGHGYTGPNYHALRVPLLKEAKTQVNLTILSLRSKWAETGCTIMGDGWTDRCHRTLINFLVYCPYVISFMKSCDVSDIVSNAENLCNLFSSIVEMVGEKMWDGWTEIITPGATRFGTNFIALKSLYDHKEHLEAMVICSNYKKFMKIKKGRGVKDTVLSQRFWNNYLIIVKIMEPLMRLLRICDTGEKPSLGYVYEGLSRAIRGTKEIFNNQESKYKPFVDIINKRWDKMLRKRLHAAAYWLNPAF